MDPNVTLEQIREMSATRDALRAEMSRLEDEQGRDIPSGDWQRWDDLGQSLLEFYEALDEWLCRGGRLPREWERK